MMQKLLVVVLFAILLKQGECLKCYVCSEEECNDPTKLKDQEQGCHPATKPKNDTCLKLQIGEKIIKRCGIIDNNKCELDALKLADPNFANVINSMKTDDKTKVTPYCCNEDLCNSALDRIPSSVILIGLPLIIAAIFCRN